MIKYIWIFMILALYIFWAYGTAKDTLRCVHYFVPSHVLDELEGYALAFYLTHILLIFLFSFLTFFAWY